MNKRVLPAYPLFVNDPYFSVWSPSDVLNDEDTVFWTGSTRKTYGFVVADGEVYGFLGKTTGKKLQQTSVSVRAFSTDYTFTCDKFDLRVRFLSPLLPTDIRLASRPVCYFQYELTAKAKIDTIKVVLALHQGHCYEQTEDFVVGGGFAREGYETAFFGLNRQLPMSHSADNYAADWGYTYVAAQQATFTSAATMDGFLQTGNVDYVYDGDRTEKYLFGVNCHQGSARGKMLVAFDDLCSAFYFGEWLNGYYFKDGATILDALDEAWRDEDAVEAKLNDFEKDLLQRLAKYDEDYKLLCFAALRQTMGAHKIVENKAGELLFLSKECDSNGCVATVDITYPSMPLFLLYDPQLVTAMLRPIFKFARCAVWEYDFAPHDAGTYPYCLGQTYGVRCRAETNSRYLSNMFRRDRQNVLHPFVYRFPKGSDVYRYESQMPIEECSNMIICCYMTMVRGADDADVKNNYDLLKKWYLYIERKGLIPEEQLCTDDFVARLDKNVNLSVKAIVALKCFALLAEKLGKKEDAAAAQATFEAFRKEFYDRFDGKSIPLTYDSPEGTFSLKYNMAYDVLLDTGIFSAEMREREVDVYLSKNTHFSVPLDSRSDLTKTDWILYCCTLTDDAEKRRALYHGVVNFLQETPCRVPFGDLYHVETAKIKDFQNRTVQGGIFILLLADEMKKGK